MGYAIFVMVGTNKSSRRGVYVVNLLVRFRLVFDSGKTKRAEAWSGRVLTLKCYGFGQVIKTLKSSAVPQKKEIISGCSPPSHWVVLSKWKQCGYSFPTTERKWRLFPFAGNQQASPGADIGKEGILFSFVWAPNFVKRNGE